MRCGTGVAARARLVLSDINAAALDQTLDLLPADIQVRGYQLDLSSSQAT
jgi:hypothetical protein